MKCPKCKKQVDGYIFDRDSNMCCQCGYQFSESKMKKHMEPEDCPLVRDGEIDSDKFDPDYYCEDCHYDCILASSCLDDWGYQQDEEGNWGYDD